MKNAGCSKGVITSTIRTPEEQVDIMYRNAKTNLAGQYSLYGSNGDAVLKVYEDNKQKPEAEVKRLMVAKVKELLQNNRARLFACDHGRKLSTQEHYRYWCQLDTSTAGAVSTNPRSLKRLLRPNETATSTSSLMRRINRIIAGTWKSFQTPNHCQFEAAITDSSGKICIGSASSAISGSIPDDENNKSTNTIP
ncbi:MAG: hypothetical protein R3C56_29235 [Pirellulaceae bacterium]